MDCGLCAIVRITRFSSPFFIGRLSAHFRRPLPLRRRHPRGQVDDVVGGFDELDVVLDNDHGVAARPDPSIRASRCSMKVMTDVANLSALADANSHLARGSRLPHAQINFGFNDGTNDNFAVDDWTNRDGPTIVMLNQALA